MQYLSDSAIFAAIITIIPIAKHYLGGVPDRDFTDAFNLWNRSSEFVAFFAISFTLNWLLGELSVKRYNRICQKLEEEADEDD
ncbi:hypothetical protein [Gorillibacterium timonense]|uniref:hypothetical protein n=1 Tax=Gorillibacterium timonense TaxID=1689269 RepID=UPI00071E321E|nr:hypothetical protein [Gorillibacterium timonense]